MRVLLRSSFIPSLVAATVLATGCADEAATPSASARVATLDTVLTVDLSGLPTPTPASPVAVNDDRSLIAIGLRGGSGEIMVFDGEGELVRHFASAWAPGATEPSQEITLRGRFFGAA